VLLPEEGKHLVSVTAINICNIKIKLTKVQPGRPIHKKRYIERKQQAGLIKVFSVRKHTSDALRNATSGSSFPACIESRSSLQDKKVF
jgi:hypothetical protein